MKGDQIWQGLSGGANQWRAAAQEWMNQAKGFFKPPVLKIQVLEKPVIAIKTNPGDVVVVPFKFVASDTIETGSIFGILNPSVQPKEIICEELIMNKPLGGQREFSLEVPLLIAQDFKFSAAGN